MKKFLFVILLGIISFGCKGQKVNEDDYLLVRNISGKEFFVIDTTYNGEDYLVIDSTFKRWKSIYYLLENNYKFIFRPSYIITFNENDEPTIQEWTDKDTLLINNNDTLICRINGYEDCNFHASRFMFSDNNYYTHGLGFLSYEAQIVNPDPIYNNIVDRKDCEYFIEFRFDLIGSKYICEVNARNLYNEHWDKLFLVFDKNINYTDIEDIYKLPNFQN